MSVRKFYSKFGEILLRIFQKLFVQKSIGLVEKKNGKNSGLSRGKNQWTRGRSETFLNAVVHENVEV